MITFIRNNKTVSLAPKYDTVDNPFLNNVEGAAIEGDNVNNDNSKRNNNYKFLNIDGVVHTLQETPTTKSTHKNHLDEDFINHTVGEKKFVKRSGSPQPTKRLMTVEIFTVIDYSTFNWFVGLSKATSNKEKKEDARKTIRHFFTHVMEKLKEIYERIDTEDLKFTTRWVGAFIAESPNDLPSIGRSMNFRGNLDFDTLLKNLKGWLKDELNQPNKLSGPKFDFLVVFTSHSLETVIEQPQKRIQGHYGGADRKKVCTVERVGFVVRQGIFETASTLAHELGHSLGAYHDGYYNDCNPMHYIMGTSNSEYFSRCSIDAFKSTVATLDEQSNNCLEDGGEDFDYGQDRNKFLNLHPGQIYDLDEQCRMVFGTASFFTNYKFSPVCSSITCFRGTHLRALDRTSCGKGAWCHSRTCVDKDSKAPRDPDHCVYGDYALSVSSLNENQCQLYARHQPKMCDIKNVLEPFSVSCCATCAGNRTSVGVCSDIIDECSSLQPKDCYNDYYAITCCKTCQTLVLNPSDANCLYGDRGTGCKDMLPEVCHLPTHHCCQTCAESCTRDYSGTLEYVNVWRSKLHLSCKQLVERDSSLCRNDSVQKYCCSSCSSVKLAEDTCKGDNDTLPHVYLSKKFTCKELVAYMPRLCEKESFKSKCCKSCGQFTIRPYK